MNMAIKRIKYINYILSVVHFSTFKVLYIFSSSEGEPQQATALTAVAMTEMDADTIHVELNSITTLKFVRRFSGVSEIVAFNGLNWLDFNGKGSV